MAKDPVEAKEPKAVYLPVKVVEKRGPSILVEYQKDGRLFRVIIPVEELVDGQVDEYTLSALGIPYGLPWEQLITLTATAEQLAEHLRANGIWTKEDIEANPQAVYGAIQAVYGVELSRLLQAAHNYKP